MQPLLDVSTIHLRLKSIFAGGLPNLNYVTREMAAKVTFVMLYCDAIDGSGFFLRPDQVTRMTDKQSKDTDEQARVRWRIATMRPHKGGIPRRWYQTNTREPIRDETLRQGLVAFGAATERKDLPATSSVGKYALTKQFAALFDPQLSSPLLEEKIQEWQEQHLTAAARARVYLHRKSAVLSDEGVLATLPNGERRLLSIGPSSIIAKAVLEEFAPRFLKEPGLLWLSESSKKEDKRDLELANHLGIDIDAAKHLPDIILVDTGGGEALFLFVEIVASDGPITEDRQTALMALLQPAGYGSKNAAFVTAYLDRGGSAFRKTISTLAWNSFAWCTTEPNKIIGMHDQACVGTIKEFVGKLAGT